MEQLERLKRLGWFLPLRLATYVILLGVIAFWMGYPAYLQLLVILYSVCTLGFTLTIALERRVALPAVTQVLIAFQFLLEIALESGVIYATGNVNSPFSALFLLTIVSAALAYRMIGTLVIASLVSVAYAFIIWLGLGQSGDADLNLQVLRTIFSSQDYVFYSIFVHILIFYLVAFISGYLAERLSSQDRKLADASHALKLARLETDDILRHVSSGLLTIDASGTIVYFNRAAEKTLGYREEDVRGLPCEEVFAERMPILAQSLMEGLRRSLEYPRRELEIINGDRIPVPLGLSTSILVDEGSAIRGVIAIFTDLRDAKLMEAKVRAADRLSAVGELSASIAHEIRNPLAAISGSVEVLMKETEFTGENARLMQLIVKESTRLNKILTDFLSYARVNRPAYDKIELCRVINDVIELMRHHEVCTDNVRVTIDADESFVYVVGDADLIKQLLVNLGLNACEAFDGKGGNLTFELRTYRLSGTARLNVIDTGPGIPAKDLDRVFQPFYSTKKHGTGLGLAIVHRISTTLSLGIGVQSSPRGTTFSIEFPLFSQHAGSLPSVSAAADAAPPLVRA